MTSKKAFSIAISNSAFAEQVKKFQNKNPGMDAGCICYSIGDEAFSYAWCECDGFTHHKMSAKRSAYLISKGKTFVIE